MKTLAAASLALTLVTTGCAGVHATGGPRVSEAEQMRRTLSGQDVQALAPQAFAEADQALGRAREAERAKDATAADLYAERALAAYQRAIALGRLARATEEEAAATDALAKARDQGQRFLVARKAAERDASDLDKQLRVAREAALPTQSGAATPEREKARRIAAQALVVQARLLCSAARLVSPDAAGLVEAESAATELEKKDSSVSIDASARARTACLDALTKARRKGQQLNADQADALLSELSPAVDPKTKGNLDVSPARDERGVVVTLRGLFKGDALSSEGESALKDLGRVAASHPALGVQIVVHDAAPPSATEVAADKRRADAITRALAAGGATPTKLKTEQAGARAPIVDPEDARRRERNARIEVVFVGGA